jgi:hypothetical protein
MQAGKVEAASATEPELAGSLGDRSLGDTERESSAQKARADLAHLEEALGTVKLTGEEVEFLACPEIGQLAAKEPRAVKRLVNIYRILRARMSSAELRELLGHDSKPPTYPIAVLLTAVETGQAVEIADGLYERLRGADETMMIHDLLAETSSGETSDDVFRGPPTLQDAFKAAQEKRKGSPITVGECAAMARVVRRYSFNLYQ